MSIVQNHPASTASNTQAQNVVPTIPDTSLHLDNTDQYISTEQESLSQRFHPAFDAARIEEVGLMDNANRNPNQGGHQ